MKIFFLAFFLCLAIPVFGQFPYIKWFFDTDDMAFGNAACADIDKDDTLEIVFGCYRNDSNIYALNAEDGSLLWLYNTGGCNDVAPLIYDVNGNNQLEVIVPSSCVPKTFCLDGTTGGMNWYVNTRGSDSPPTLADMDNDGALEILHGEFGGYVLCINADTGTVAWEIAVDLNSWIQTAPVIVDLNMDGQLDFVVANWNFDTSHTVFAYDGATQGLLWKNHLPNDYMYHGASVADLDGDKKPELVIGCYDGTVYVFNGEDGSLAWQYGFSPSYYVGAPTSIADFNNDGYYEIIFFDWYKAGMLSHDGNLLWQYDIPSYGTAFRGAAVSDIDGDDTLDVVFGTDKGHLIALNGSSGSLIWIMDLAAHYGGVFEIDHGPIIADFDNDGMMDVFVVGGHAEYPDIWNNYGRAYAIAAGVGTGPEWPMFRRDIRRTACVPIDSTNMVNPHKPEKSLQPMIIPNPVTGDSRITFNNEKSLQAVLNVFAVTGSLVVTETTYANIFHVGSYNLVPGVYHFQIKTEETSSAGEFMVR